MSSTANKLFPVNPNDKSPVSKNTELFNNLVDRLEVQKIILLKGMNNIQSEDRINDLYDAAYNKLFEASLLIKESINYK